MDDDELKEELNDEVNPEIDSNHEDIVLKTLTSIKSKSPEPSTFPASDITQKNVILKRKLNIVVSLDNTSTTPLEKIRKISISIPTTTDKSLDDASLSINEQENVETTDKKGVKESELTVKERLELQAALIEGDTSLLDESFLNNDIMDDDAVLKTHADSIIDEEHLASQLYDAYVAQWSIFKNCALGSSFTKLENVLESIHIRKKFMGFCSNMTKKVAICGT